jgi:hypothetical protein
MSPLTRIMVTPLMAVFFRQYFTDKKRYSDTEFSIFPAIS